MFWIISSTIVGLMMAVTMIFIRLRASKKPTSTTKIILPPLFMSTGALMFLFPMFQVSVQQVFEAFLVGLIFSFFLIKTSNFEIKEGYIYLIPSKFFIIVLIGLLLIRFTFKLVFSQTLALGETSGMFFILAFGMIISWRTAMFVKYKKLEKLL